MQRLWLLVLATCFVACADASTEPSLPNGTQRPTHAAGAAEARIVADTSASPREVPGSVAETV